MMTDSRAGEFRRGEKGEKTSDQFPAQSDFFL